MGSYKMWISWQTDGVFYHPINNFYWSFLEKEFNSKIMQNKQLFLNKQQTYNKLTVIVDFVESPSRAKFRIKTMKRLKFSLNDILCHFKLFNPFPTFMFFSYYMKFIINKIYCNIYWEDSNSYPLNLRKFF